jgi:hypothetical protein
MREVVAVQGWMANGVKTGDEADEVVVQTGYKK